MHSPRRPAWKRLKVILSERDDRYIPASTAKRSSAPRTLMVTLAALSSAWRCRLLRRLCRTACSAIAIKQHTVCAQIGDQRVEIVRQLLIIQQCCHQTLALHGAAQNFARVSNRR